jgi:tRNA (guanine6-N2)-methyltransferase
VRAVEAKDDDSFLDPMCGSGTLLIERLSLAPTSRIAGWDIAAEALEATELNLRAARLRTHIALSVVDICARPLPAERFDVVVTNLPWGTLVGTHEANDDLYPAVLDALMDLTTPTSRVALLTHDVARFEAAVATSDWAIESWWRFFQKGHHPRLYRLGRRHPGGAPRTPTGSP